MDRLIKVLSKTAPLQGDLDYKLIRASTVIIYFFFGCQKWFDYEMQGLVPFFNHGPLIFWMYSVFGMKGSTYLLGVSEWLFGGLILAGFWKRSWECWELWGRCSPSPRQLRLFRLCRMVGRRRQGDFRRWWGTSPS